MVAFRLYNVFAVALFVSVLLGTSGAYGYVIDGQLNDWGVTPFSHWTPTAGIASVVENWGDQPGQTGSYPYGGEVFDIEAAYTTNDAGHLYIGIVSSMPEMGVNDPYGRPYHIMPGDIAVSVDGGATYVAGIVGSGPNMGKVYLNPTWSLPSGAIGFPQNGPSHLSGGTLIAQGTAVYADAGALEPDGSHTYVIEMGIPVDWSMLSMDPSNPNLHFHYTMDCGNDKLDWDYRPIQTPEPSVLALIVSGLGTILLRRRSSRETVTGA
jgi:hypothetical protein